MVEKRNTIPILANVMIAVRDVKLTLTATDMEIAVVEEVDGKNTSHVSDVTGNWFDLSDKDVDLAFAVAAQMA